MKAVGDLSNRIADFKGKAVISFLRTQKLNLWPEATVIAVNSLITRNRNYPIKRQLMFYNNENPVKVVMFKIICEITTLKNS